MRRASAITCADSSSLCTTYIIARVPDLRMRHVHFGRASLVSVCDRTLATTPTMIAGSCPVIVNRLAERILARPEHVGQPAADHDHSLCALAIARLEVAPRQDRNAHRLEVVGVDDARERAGTLSRRRRRPIRPRERMHVFARAERQPRDARDARDAGKSRRAARRADRASARPAASDSAPAAARR